MAIFSSGYDKDGRHVISGGHKSPFADTSTPSKTKQSIGAVPESLHLRLDIDGKDDKLYTGSNNIYKLKGMSDLTVPGSVVAYLNGSPMYPNDYTVDMVKRTIEIHRYIKATDCDIEVRSKEDTNFVNINDVLILEVTPGFIEYEDLESYTPDYGDEVNLSRVAGILRNFKNEMFMREVKNTTQTAYVLSHEIKPDGIYARIKVSDING